jgi:hypothetical protein
MDARKAVETLAIVGIGVFAIVIILSLTYQGYATTNNQLVTTYCKGVGTAGCTGSNDLGSGTVQNFSKYAGQLPNTYASNLGLAITALVLFVVIAIIAGLFLNQKGGGVLGGGGE